MREDSPQRIIFSFLEENRVKTGSLEGDKTKAHGCGELNTGNNVEIGGYMYG